MTKLPTNRGGSATLGEVTSIRSPCGSGSNATTPPRRPPVAARTRSPATAIPPTRPGPVLNSQTSCPDEASTATRRPSPKPTRAVPPTTTSELRRMNSLNWKSNRRLPSAGSNPHTPPRPSATYTAPPAAVGDDVCHTGPTPRWTHRTAPSAASTASSSPLNAPSETATYTEPPTAIGNEVKNVPTGSGTTQEGSPEDADSATSDSRFSSPMTCPDGDGDGVGVTVGVAAAPIASRPWGTA